MISVVLPVHNEAGNLERLFRELIAAMEGVGRPFEVIFVDDVSTDASHAVISRLAGESRHRIVVLRFTRRFGQTAALAAGFDHARGEIVVTMDADGQNDPSDIPQLLRPLEEGCDVVSGWRVKRAGAWFSRRLPSQAANAITRRLFGVPVHDIGCTLKAYRRQVLTQIHLSGEQHRFLPILAAWVGARVTEVPVRDRVRGHGASKYGLGRTIKVLLDLMTLKFLVSFGSRPGYVFGVVGLLLTAAGLGLAGMIALRVALWGGSWISPAIFLMAITLVCGVQCMLMGLLAEFTIRIYQELSRRPLYLIRRDAPARE
ncbi:MAG: glycosyltransferase family 2 protein [Candidatus Omnitrophica bacterium]|nr:glycosyltransferase family 2 protein [Candidatus Omnitrophota bacterium]